MKITKITYQGEIRVQLLEQAQLSRHFKLIVLLQQWGWNNVSVFPTVPVFQWYWEIFMNELINIDRSLSSMIQDKVISCLLYGSDAFYNKTNHKIIIFTLLFIKDTAQKVKFSIKDFFSKCDQIRRKLRIWSHLLKKSLMVNFIFLCSETHTDLTIPFSKSFLFCYILVIQIS